ncbi:NAD-dependent epimerase/dehydratase family protein [Lysobacter sp. GX 14042]|uniref:NAD-dependent epimerase/dehydratase family protein n=1 Tax=Lysobacter sp. GX 14042 TaxID=2907155 RepID=UPI001F3C73F2|nr:NAD-dependent epimerase/dehydratase family protein [Lysobacter sp. GX 14042]MCE7032678.1 NAD-dependent epimerase/dehydratase family protein [Lysobacter sp. GX 14042]
MTVLVTGATGRLGGALVRRLAASGQAVRVLVRAGSDQRAIDATCAAFPQARIERVTGSLDPPRHLDEALAGVELVYHLAAAMRGGPAAVLGGTLGTSRQLLQALAGRPRPPRVLLVSSLSVYGTATLADHATVDEDTPLEPHPCERDLYAYAKLEQERLFRDHCGRQGIPLAVVRPGVLHEDRAGAPGARVGFGPWRGLFVLLGGDNPLPLVHVDSCAAALVHVAAHARFDADTYNLVDPDPPTCREALARYRAARGGQLLVVPVPPPLLRVAAALFPVLHALSHGRVPLLLSPYRRRTTWRPLHYPAGRLHALGFRPPARLHAGTDADAGDSAPAR